MRKFLVILLVAGMAAGCHSLLTTKDRPISAQELTWLQTHALAPAEIGLRVIRNGDQTSVRWKEKVFAENPVTVGLLPPDTKRSAQPMVAARINMGAQFPLVIDTGAPVNLLHCSAIERNHVRVVDPKKLGNLFAGPGGTELAYYGMIDYLAVGSLCFQNALTAIRTRAYERRFGNFLTIYRWEGNSIGLSSLLRLSFLTLDYPHKKATLSSRHPFLPPPDNVVLNLAFQVEAMQIIVPLRLGNSEPFNVVVDTGNDASLMLPTNIIRRLGYEKLASQGRRSEYVGMGGSVITRAFKLPSLQLANQTFSQVETVVAPDTYPATLGSGFLKTYQVTLDFRQKMLWLYRAL